MAKYDSRDINDCSLMKSAPRRFKSSTAFRPSSGLATATELGNRGFGPSSMGPEVTIRGPSSFPCEISLRHRWRTSSSPPMSRTEVTPLARNSGKAISSLCGNQSPNTMCTCMSQSPGMRNFPEPSTTWAP